MNKKYFGIVAGLLLLAGCSNDDNMNEQQGVTDGLKSITTLNATIGDKANTRAYIVDGAGAGYKEMAWSDGDKIGVYSNAQHNPSIFELARVTDNVGVFTGSRVNGSQFYAFYPAREEQEWIVDEDNPFIWHFNYNNLVATVSDTGYFYDGPMVATSFDDSFSFKQTMGLIHFSFNGTFTLDEIVLRGNLGEPLTGWGYVNLLDDYPVFTLSDDGETYDNSRIWYDGEYMEDGSKDIYFAIPPTTFEKGINVTISGRNEAGENFEFVKVFNSRLVVERAEIKNFASFTVTDDQTPPVDPDFVKTYEALMAFYRAMGGVNSTLQNGWGKTDVPFNEWDGLSATGNTVYRIDLQNCGLEGSIPTEIADLPLESLVLSGNTITSYNAIKNLTNLKELVLSNAQIEGDLPSFIGNLTNLEIIDLSNNNFKNYIPSSWYQYLSNLKQLNLAGNRLTGSIYTSDLESVMWQSLQANQTDENWWRDLVYNQQEGYGMEIPVSSITINPSRVELHVGETIQLTYEVTPTIASHQDEWYWSCSNDDVTVSAEGLVTAVHTGGATVYLKKQNGNTLQSVYVSCLEPLVDGGAEDFTIEGRGW